MIPGIGKTTAFTTVRGYSEARVKEAKEKLDADLELLRKSSEEVIIRLQVEIEVLQRRIKVLEGTLTKERVVRQEAFTAMGLELEIEKKKQQQTQRERDFLLQVFQRRKPETDCLPDETAGHISPWTRDMTNRTLKEEYDSWESDWQAYLQVKGSNK